MKKLAIIFTLTALVAGNVLAGNEGKTDEKSGEEKDKKTYHVQRQSATIVSSQIFFNVTLDAESENCIYSLVRFNQDGSMASVGIKEGLKNVNNLELLYSFKETEKPEEDVEYTLYRIGSGSEPIAQWNYNSVANTIESQQLVQQTAQHD